MHSREGRFSCKGRLLSGKPADWKEKNRLAKFQLIVSDPKNKTSKAASLEGTKAQALVGKSIGEEIDGKLLGLGNVKLRITGGTDKDGVPMRFDIQVDDLKSALFSAVVGNKLSEVGDGD